MLRVFFCNL